jgi:hypothetical protein
VILGGPPPPAGLSVTPAALDFGTVQNFAESDVSTVTIKNDGASLTTLYLTSITSNDISFKTERVVLNGVVTVLPVEVEAEVDVVEVEVRFTPHTTGRIVGQLHVVSTVGDASVALSGRNNAPPTAVRGDWTLYH